MLLPTYLNMIKEDITKKCTNVTSENFFRGTKRKKSQREISQSKKQRPEWISKTRTRMFSLFNPFFRVTECVKDRKQGTVIACLTRSKRDSLCKTWS